MASKKELLQAQQFARRRLLTTFMSGRPNGKELEPTAPLRAVTAGIALAVIVVLATVGASFFQKKAPNDWLDHKIVVDGSTGARYYTSIDANGAGVIYSVANTASAYLLVGDAKTKPTTIAHAEIVKIPQGDAIGIAGAPDDLPAPKNLIADGWTSCVRPGPTPTQETTLSADPTATAVNAAVIVTEGGIDYVVEGGLRYEIVASTEATVRAALQLMEKDAPAIPVSARWLNVFPAGSRLMSVTIDGAGTVVILGNGSEATVGEVYLADQGSGEQPFVVMADGKLARMTQVEYALYINHNNVEPSKQSANFVTEAGVSSVNVGPDDWPEAVVPALGAGMLPCALLTITDGSPAVTLAEPIENDVPGPPVEVTVAAGAGALVRTTPTATMLSTSTDEPGGAQIYLIDGRGIAFPIPGTDEEIGTSVTSLGYEEGDVTTVPAPWLLLFREGTALTRTAAEAPVGDFVAQFPAAPVIEESP